MLTEMEEKEVEDYKPQRQGNSDCSGLLYLLFGYVLLNVKAIQKKGSGEKSVKENKVKGRWNQFLENNLWPETATLL